MTRNEHILQTLAEECVEVAKEVSKALRFGLSDRDPFDPSSIPNRENIVYEAAQLLAMLDLAHREKLIPKSCAMMMASYAYLHKPLRFESMLTYSEKRGTLTK